MSKFIVMTLFAAVLAGCSTSHRHERIRGVPAADRPVPVARPTIPMTSQLEASTVELVKEALKDPDSAKFSDLKAYGRESDPRSIDVCGRVNAKNSYGGYSGSAWFVVTRGEVLIYDSYAKGANANNSIVRVLCGL